MNKVVAILGVIILITLGALFFCVGFFTGTTMPSMLSAKTEQTEQSTSEKITLEDIKAKISAESSDISNKVSTILSSGAQTVSDSVSQTINKVQAIKLRPFEISSDILLKEIIASHAEHDDCSLEKNREKFADSGEI